MPQARLLDLAGAHCYHVTQRCQERRFLLGCQMDRSAYLRRLWEAKGHYAVAVLNYMVTSNHVHLLLRSEAPAEVSRFMQYLSAAAAQDYNRRKHREGAFWRGRYRPTLIESGEHLCRCFFYIELNMVRAGAAQTPRDWFGGAWQEHLGQRQRYRIIDRPALMASMRRTREDGFVEWYTATVEQLCAAGKFAREPWWSQAAAVGSRNWVSAIAGRLPESWCRVETAADGALPATEESYALDMSRRRHECLLKSLVCS